MASIANWAAEVPRANDAVGSDHGDHVSDHGDNDDDRNAVAEVVSIAQVVPSERKPTVKKTQEQHTRLQKGLTYNPANWALFVVSFGVVILRWFATFKQKHPNIKALPKSVGQESIKGGRGGLLENFFAQEVQITSAVFFPVMGKWVVTSVDGDEYHLDPNSMLTHEQLLHENNYVNPSFNEVSQILTNLQKGIENPPSQMVCDWDVGHVATPVVVQQAEITPRTKSQGARCHHGHLISDHKKTETGLPRHPKRKGVERCDLLPSAGKNA